MNIRRTVERVALKVRGMSLQEMEEEWRQLDAAKARREAERQKARQKALRQQYEWERGRS